MSSSVANLLQYLCAKNYQNTMQLSTVIAKKIKWCIFAPQCIYTNHILNRHSKFGEDRMNNAVF